MVWAYLTAKHKSFVVKPKQCISGGWEVNNLFMKVKTENNLTNEEKSECERERQKEREGMKGEVERENE